MLRCRGNEPFWHLEMNSQRTVFRELGSDPVAERFRGQWFAGGTEWYGRTRDGRTLAMSVTPALCRDTMSDETPPTAYTVLVTTPRGIAARGCCEAVPLAPAPSGGAPRADPESKPPDDWARDVVELWPAMGTCLGAVPRDPPRVVTAWFMNRDRVGVRTRSAAGVRFDCIADETGEAVAELEALPDSPSRLPGEGQPLFSPATLGPPTGECYDHERVVVDGRTVGWLSYDTC